MDGMTGRVQVSIRLPTDLLDGLDRIATAMERDRSWVIVRALRQYLDGEGAEILREADGLAALDRGESFDLDAVLDEGDAIIAQARREQSQAGQ